jgi:hypothetical protein
MLTDESAVMRPQTSKYESAVNVEHLIGGMRQQREWWSKLKESGDVEEVARKQCPDESAKNPVTLSKAPLIGEEGIEHLRHS